MRWSSSPSAAVARSQVRCGPALPKYVSDPTPRWGDSARAPSTRPTARYSERAVERRLRLYFPGYRELPIVPAFSSLSIPGG